MSANANTGFVAQIQRFSLDDGPGIRTTVFLKGCNLRCVWCHNPESIAPYAEVAFDARQCTGCGACAAACVRGAQHCTPEGRWIDRGACVRCLACVRSCAGGALTAIGQKMTVEQVIHDVLRDRAFYGRSGGGVTFSGGEPMLQRDFLLGLLVAGKEHGLYTAVDTAGNVPFESFLSVMPHTDLFLYDIKAFSPELHRRYTGVDNGLILRNLRSLSRQGARLWVRLPYAAGVNNDPGEVAAICDFLRGTPGIERIELLPYHRYGQGKYQSLGLASPCDDLRPPEPGELRDVLELYKRHGVKVDCPTLG